MSAYSDAVLADSPLLYLRLDESSGSSCANAGSLGGTATCNGTFTRNATAAHTNLGVAVTLEGVGDDDYIAYPDTASLDITGDFTYELWAKVTSGVVAGTYLMSKGRDSPSVGGYGIFVPAVGPPNFSLGIRAANGTILTSGNVVHDTNWHHIVVTRVSNAWTIYVDGSSVATTSSSATPQATTKPLLIGVQQTEFGFQSGLNGSVDEIAVYNTGLSSTRVAAHYSAYNAATAPPIQPSGIPSSEAFGAVTIRLALQTLRPSGIASAQAFGAATLLGGLRVLLPSGIPSREAVGSATVGRAAVTLLLTGITSGEAFGTPAMAFGHLFPTRQTIDLDSQGIPSAEAFGGIEVDLLTRGVYPLGWAELEPFGTPTLTTAPSSVRPVGIASAQTLGVPFLAAIAPPSDPSRPPPPRNYLIDRLTREVYPWPVNHTSEDAIKSLGRQLTRSGINPGGFTIRQRTVPGPTQLVLQGSMIDQDQAQYRTFVRFFGECEDRTFDYIDAAGDSYHVAIVSFDARRKLSPSHVNGSYFTYTLEVEVIGVNHGALVGIGV